MKIITILTAAVLGLTAAASYAQSTQTVSFADLDIATASGMTVLVQRVAKAANKVCGVESGIVDLASHIDARNCSRRAVTAALFGLRPKAGAEFAAR